MNDWIIKRGVAERHVPDAETLVRIAQEGRMKATDLVFHPTMQQWLSASEVPEIKNVFGTPQPETSLAAEPAATLASSVADNSQNTTSIASNRPFSDVWGSTSRVFGFIGGVIAIAGGIKLVMLRAASENSLIEAIAHGIGVYCVGKGLFMISAVANFKAAVDFVSKRLR